MKILLSPQESESYFFNALCNSLSYFEDSYELELTYSKKEYATAVSNLASNTVYDFTHSNPPSFEEVLMQILRDGGKLIMLDKGYGEYTRVITLKDVHERVQDSMLEHLLNMINQKDDAVTGDVILQQVFFSDVIFG